MIQRERITLLLRYPFQAIGMSVSRLRRVAIRVRNWVGARTFGTFVCLVRNVTRARIVCGVPRTLWGTTPILTLPLLSRCDQMLGLKSDALVFVTYYITRNFSLNLEKWEKRFLARKGNAYHRWRTFVFAYALLRYDIFHYFYDRGILPSPLRIGICPEELEILRITGKRVYLYAYGSDVRTRNATLALGSYNLCGACDSVGRYCICDETQATLNMENCRRAATALLAMGDMVAYVPEHINMHYWPIEITRHVSASSDPGESRPFRIAHAPNHPHFKGTSYLEAAIDRLRAEGRNIELIRIQGVSNHRVIELFTSADVVADQFVAGFHGYTALEAMSLGKPVLCYLRGPDMAIDASRCPIINANPDSLYDVLKGCVDGEFDLKEIGLRSRRYVERYYSLPAVAARLGNLYLASGRLSERTCRKIERRIAELELELPEMIDQPPPVAWALTATSDRGPTARTSLVS